MLKSVHLGVASLVHVSVGGYVGRNQFEKVHMHDYHLAAKMALRTRWAQTRLSSALLSEEVHLKISECPSKCVCTQTTELNTNI
jgi:hypothetical protein